MKMTCMDLQRNGEILLLVSAGIHGEATLPTGRMPAGRC